MTTSECFLHIRRTWHGEALPEHEHVSVELSLHHIAPPAGSEEDEATGGWGHRELQIAISAPFHGDAPPPPAQGSKRCYDGLWHHEVVEVFIGGPRQAEDTPYIELEFGPHGHALGLGFDRYRERRETFEIEGEAWLRGPRWQARAIVPFHRLPPLPWRVNAFALHGPPEARVYKAAGAARPGRTPDFHAVDTWLPCALVWPLP
jgi:hypothetical protein